MPSFTPIDASIGASIGLKGFFNLKFVTTEKSVALRHIEMLSVRKGTRARSWWFSLSIVEESRRGTVKEGENQKRSCWLAA